MADKVQFDPESMEGPKRRAAREARERKAQRRRVLEDQPNLTPTIEELKQVTAAVAMFDPRRLYYDDGTAVNITELDRATALAISGIKVMQEYDGSREQRVHLGYTQDVRTADRLKAVQLYAELNGWLKTVGATQQKDRLEELYAARRAPIVEADAKRNRRRN